MFICKQVLTKDEVKTVLDKLDKLEWSDGTTGLDKSHKNNKELVNEELSNFVGEKIMTQPKVVNYSFIKKMVLPRFNCYSKGGEYKQHVDSFYSVQCKNRLVNDTISY